jgi:4-amino-4-deoxy-L-arabinose transferase-like glycosyltransferase
MASLGGLVWPARSADALQAAPRGWLSGLLTGVAVALANGLLLAPIPLGIRALGALMLFVLLPGYLFVASVFRDSRPPILERYLLAVGCGYALVVLMALLLHALFRPLDFMHILVGANLLNVGLLLSALARGVDLCPRLPRPCWPLLPVLAVAAVFRMPNLGHSEFQGDEAEVVLRTLAVVQGVPDALISHRKPPAEILTTAAFGGGLGTITESEARLPFAVAGVAAVGAIYLLGQTWFGATGGLVAGLLLAVNGYFVAFARVLQYQSLALLLDTLAVLCLFRFSQKPSRSYALAGGLLLAGSALSALSAIFLVPVAAVAFWRLRLRSARISWRDLAVWIWPLGLLAPTVGVVYAYVASGSGDSLDLASTWLYLGPRVGVGQPYFNLERLLLATNHYTSSLYLLVVGGAGGLILVKALYESSRQAAKALAAPGLCLSIAFAAVVVDVRNLSLALLLSGAIVFVIATARRPIGWRLALTWCAVPLLVHLFLIRNPGTHWREIFPGLVLLVAAAAAAVYSRLWARPARLAAVVVGGLFLVATGHYVYAAWIQTWPEYQSLYPTYRHPLDWSNQTSTGVDGVYGAAHRHGWKAVAELMADGQLPSAYDTNESEAVSAWYLKRARACGEAIELFVQAPRTLRHYQSIQAGETPRGYAVSGWVYVDGRPTTMLLQRQPQFGSPTSYESQNYGSWFDREFASPWTAVGQLYRAKEISPDCPRSR